MAVIWFTRGALLDLERLFQFRAQTDPDAARQIETIEEAIQVLARHPLIGRKVAEGRRELVISRGKTGYIALYRWWDDLDVVLVLAIRHQREAGYVGD